MDLRTSPAKAELSTLPESGTFYFALTGMIQVFDRVTIKGYHWVVKVSELRRWLKKQGCMFVEESRHTRIVLGSRISRMPRHPAKEIKRGTLQTVLKDLDLKM